MIYPVISKIKKFRKSRDTLIAILLVLVLGVMFFWRFLLAGASSRYWAGALIPMFLLIGYFLYGKWFGRGISRLLLCIVICGFIFKDLRFNWNNRAITNAAAAIIADARSYESAFCAEIEKSEVLTRLEYYTPFPALPYENGIELETILNSARGLYDVCYIITMDDHRKRTSSRKKIEQANAELIFRQDKDMRRREQICVYKLPVPGRQAPLPITGELWPNGDFEDIEVRSGKETFPRYYGKIANVSLADREVISGKYSLYSKSAGLSFVHSIQVLPPVEGGTLLFTVSRAPRARIGFYIWKFNEKGKRLSRNIVLNAILPDDKRTHQFQIPFSAEEFEDATRIQCYWYLSAPYGMLLDDFGIYRAYGLRIPDT